MQTAEQAFVGGLAAVASFDRDECSSSAMQEGLGRQAPGFHHQWRVSAPLI